MTTHASPEQLAVYVIHWRAPEWCAATVRALVASPGVTVSVTIIDNGGLDGVDVPSGVRVLPQPTNRGYAGGANAALEDWRLRFPVAELCVLTSHDVSPESEALAHLVSVAKSTPSAGVIAPVIVEPFTSSGGVWHGRHGEQVPLDPDAAPVLDRDWASGSCLVIRRRCAEEVGGFDERFGSYMEDVDFCLRARDRGWRVVTVPAARIRTRGSLVDDANTRIAVNNAMLAVKRGGPARGVAAVAEVVANLARTTVARRWPFRSPERRRVSAAAAQQHLDTLRGIRAALPRFVRDGPGRSVRPDAP